MNLQNNSKEIVNKKGDFLISLFEFLCYFSLLYGYGVGYFNKTHEICSVYKFYLYYHLL